MMRLFIEDLGQLREAIAGSKKHVPWPSANYDLHKAVTSVERRADAAPLHKAASSIEDKTQGRYLKGLAVAIEKGNVEVAREFYSKLSKATVTKYVPVNVTSKLREEKEKQGGGQGPLSDRARRDGDGTQMNTIKDRMKSLLEGHELVETTKPKMWKQGEWWHMELPVSDTGTEPDAADVERAMSMLNMALKGSGIKVLGSVDEGKVALSFRIR